MQKKWYVLPVLAGGLLVPSVVNAQFASSVISYTMGTGFAAGFTNANAALGGPALGGSVTPFAPPFSNTQIVSIGTGGSLTLSLSTPILNSAANPYGVDFLIFGNSFFVAGSGGVTTGGIFTSSTSTRVEVSADNVNWYTLDPSHAPLVGSLFPTDGIGNPQLPVNPALTGSSFAGLNLAGIRSLYGESAGGAGFDLSWALDGDNQSVDLPSANYVRIDVLSGRTQIDALAVVPEPSAWVVALAGVGLLCLRRRTI